MTVMMIASYTDDDDTDLSDISDIPDIKTVVVVDNADPGILLII